MEITERMILSQQLADVTKLIKAQYFAKKCGMKNDDLSTYIHIFTPSTYAPSQERLDIMNIQIRAIALTILSWRPITYGADVPAILKERKKIINLPYIFIDILGHKRDWMKKRMTDSAVVANGKEYYYYNSFTEQDVADINRAITVLGTRLKSIHLL